MRVLNDRIASETTWYTGIAGGWRHCWRVSGALPTIGLETTSLIVDLQARYPFYSGVRATIGFPPGITSVFVPLSFCMNKPLPPEPTVAMLSADPTFPITAVGLL